ncbi:hypothetical protein [Sorangium sp. So ce1024]|uniref:hypothetical protein n=1 Tax=Sorangium sp. So ce1024 TaxID=3133327 RepID=UPI003F01FA94
MARTRLAPELSVWPSIDSAFAVFTWTRRVVLSRSSITNASSPTSTTGTATFQPRSSSSDIA